MDEIFEKFKRFNPKEQKKIEEKALNLCSETTGTDTNLIMFLKKKSVNMYWGTIKKYILEVIENEPKMKNIKKTSSATKVQTKIKKENGEHISYYKDRKIKNGKIKKEYFYKNGKLERIYIEYYEDNNLVETYEKYNQTGKIIEKKVYDTIKAKNKKHIEKYNNGNIKSETVYKNEKKE